MAVPFNQTVIAVVWDFDKTLIPGNMQAPLFEHYGIDQRAFWAEVDALHDWYLAHGAERVNDDSLYLNLILEYVRAGRMPGLNNALLRELGGDLVFHPGVPELLHTLKRVVAEDPVYQRADISVEHYVVSTGLKPMIDGSAVRPLIDDVWACEFVEAHHPPGFLAPKQQKLFAGNDAEREITMLAYAIDNTSKTRALFEINKGSNKRPEIHVNSALPRDLRRVPFQNMIYVADGPSDVPAWSVVRSEGGRTLGVYQRGSLQQFEQISALQRDGRIHAFAEADYSEQSTAWLWLTSEVRRIADRIVEDRETALRRALRPPARHLPEEVAPEPPALETERQQEAEEAATSEPPRPMPARTRAEEIRDQVRASLGDEPDSARPEKRAR
ncbi:MAG TPA: hypothetical protein VFM74_04695, partial [Candidatus Limnocylindria bacterium]|nr:hypothetical protein [Candidatus Limnocylindria bacterium]